jgi:aminoglycoside phosphotransferase (APT) family kinase protein
MTDPDLPEALEAELAAFLDKPIADATPLPGALNEMVALSTPSERDAYVLRRPGALRDTDLFVPLETEYRVLELLADTDVPAPEPVAYGGEDAPLDGEFLVTEFLDGDTVPVGDPLPERFRNPDARRALAENLADAMAAVHTVDPGPLAGVCERQPPLEQVERFAAKIDAATEVTGRDVPDLRRVADWLRENAPDATETRLCHGDFKPGNVMFAPGPDPAVAGVFDWETAFLGDPRTELGYLLFYWRDDGDPTPDVDALRDEYGDCEAVRNLEATEREGFLRFSSRPGSPTRREFVARWEAATGLDFTTDERFWRAHAALGLAAVWEDLHRDDVEAGRDSDWPPLLDYTEAVAASIVDGDVPL